MDRNVYLEKTTWIEARLRRLGCKGKGFNQLVNNAYPDTIDKSTLKACAIIHQIRNQASHQFPFHVDPQTEHAFHRSADYIIKKLKDANEQLPESFKIPETVNLSDDNYQKVVRISAETASKPKKLELIPSRIYKEIDAKSIVNKKERKGEENKLIEALGVAGDLLLNAFLKL